MLERLNVQSCFLEGWRQLHEQNGAHAGFTHFGLAYDGKYFMGTSFDDVRNKMSEAGYSSSAEVIQPIAKIDAHIYRLMCGFWTYETD